MMRSRSRDSRSEEEWGSSNSHRCSSVVEDDKEDTNCDETNSNTRNYIKSWGMIQSALFSKDKFTVVTNLNRAYNNTTTTSIIFRIPTPSKEELDSAGGRGLVRFSGADGRVSNMDEGDESV